MLIACSNWWPWALPTNNQRKLRRCLAVTSNTPSNIWPQALCLSFRQASHSEIQMNNKNIHIPKVVRQRADQSIRALAGEPPLITVNVSKTTLRERWRQVNRCIPKSKHTDKLVRCHLKIASAWEMTMKICSELYSSQCSKNQIWIGTTSLLHASTNVFVKRTNLQASVTSEIRATLILCCKYTTVYQALFRKSWPSKLRFKRSKRMSRHHKTVILKARRRRTTLF